MSQESFDGILRSSCLLGLRPYVEAVESAGFAQWQSAWRCFCVVQMNQNCTVSSDVLCDVSQQLPNHLFGHSVTHLGVSCRFTGIDQPTFKIVHSNIILFADFRSKLLSKNNRLSETDEANNKYYAAITMASTAVDENER